MIKPFLFLSSILILMVLGVTFHYLSFPYKEKASSLQNLTLLTHYNQLSLSTSYQESNYNLVYPEMTSLKRMDFVYEQ